MENNYILLNVNVKPSEEFSVLFLSLIAVTGDSITGHFGPKSVAKLKKVVNNLVPGSSQSSGEDIW